MSEAQMNPLPRGALISAGALIALSITVAALGRSAPFDAASVSPAIAAPPAHSIALRFADQANGAVRVTQAPSGAAIAVVQPGSGGFLRGVLRGLTRERTMRHIGPEVPFRLSQWDNGHVEIQDLADGQRIDLDAFGPTNRAAFLRLLPGARAE